MNLISINKPKSQKLANYVTNFSLTAIKAPPRIDMLRMNAFTPL